MTDVLDVLRQMASKRMPKEPEKTFLGQIGVYSEAQVWKVISQAADALPDEWAEEGSHSDVAQAVKAASYLSTKRGYNLFIDFGEGQWRLSPGYP